MNGEQRSQWAICANDGKTEKYLPKIIIQIYRMWWVIECCLGGIISTRNEKWHEPYKNVAYKKIKCTNNKLLSFKSNWFDPASNGTKTLHEMDQILIFYQKNVHSEIMIVGEWISLLNSIPMKLQCFKYACNRRIIF